MSPTVQDDPDHTSPAMWSMLKLKAARGWLKPGFARPNPLPYFPQDDPDSTQSALLSMLKHMAARGTMLLLVDNADCLACGSAEEAFHVLHEVHDLLNQVCTGGGEGLVGYRHGLRLTGCDWFEGFSVGVKC